MWKVGRSVVVAPGKHWLPAGGGWSGAWGGVPEAQPRRGPLRFSMVSAARKTAKPLTCFETMPVLTAGAAAIKGIDLVNENDSSQSTKKAVVPFLYSGLA